MKLPALAVVVDGATELGDGACAVVVVELEPDNVVDGAWAVVEEGDELMDGVVLCAVLDGEEDEPVDGVVL